jgi:transcriptional regulator with XRE-family HTH domain
MRDLEIDDGPMIARIPCGASIPCADVPNFLAYARGVGSRKTPVTGAERAIGARIREARERLGVSVAELGLASGSTRQKVQFWERGEHFPPLRDFPTLCRLLRVDPNHILGMEAMKSLNNNEIVSVRTQIQAMALARKDEGAVRKRVARRSLQRPSARA